MSVVVYFILMFTESIYGAKGKLFQGGIPKEG